MVGDILNGIAAELKQVAGFMNSQQMEPFLYLLFLAVLVVPGQMVLIQIVQMINGLGIPSTQYTPILNGCIPAADSGYSIGYHSSGHLELERLFLQKDLYFQGFTVSAAARCARLHGCQQNPTQWNVLFAACMLCALPLLVAFSFLQKYFVGGANGRVG